MKMPLVVGTETSCGLAGSAGNRMIGNVSVSSSIEAEPIVSKRFDDTVLCSDDLYHHRNITSKILPLRFDDIVQLGGDSDDSKAPTTTLIQQRRTSPLTPRTAVSKNTKSIGGFQGTPERKPFSDELLSVERLGRNLKMRRRRNELRNLNYQEHSWTSGFAKENRLPRNIYLPEMNGDLRSGADPVTPSKFELKPRLERKIIMTHLYIKQKKTIYEAIETI